MISYATQENYARHLQPVADALGVPVRRGVHRPERREPVVIAGASDLDHVPRSSPVALLSHGADQTYIGVDHRSWAGGGGRERVSLFLCPRQDAVDANLARYPKASGAVVGCPALDVYANNRVNVAGRPPTVAFTFHPTYPAGRAVPELRSALDHYLDALPEIVEKLQAEGIRVVGHRHPRYRTLKNLWRRLGVEFVDDWPTLLGEIDCLVVDNSSAGWEALAVGAGCVWLNAPWYRRDVSHGLRFWTDQGTMVDGPDGVVGAVLTELSAPHDCSQQEAIQAVYGGVQLGDASGLAAAAIREWVD